MVFLIFQFYMELIYEETSNSGEEMAPLPHGNFKIRIFHGVPGEPDSLDAGETASTAHVYLTAPFSTLPSLYISQCSRYYTSDVAAALQTNETHQTH